MKILFTSVGRRVELIQAFRNAADKLGTNLTIIGTDITKSAPALQFCDEDKIICRISDSNYIQTLISICEGEKVDCLIPTIDTDLLLLAENKNKFELIGTKVLISRPEKVKLCRDKNYTADYFISLGLKSPQPINSVEKYESELELGHQTFPAFIKPKDGSSSINAYRVENFDDLKLYAEKIGDYIIQPFISGKEYTIDIFCDYDGNPVFITPRERLAVRAGEVLKTKITQDETMIAEMQTLVADYKPCGQITVQLIKDKKTGDNYYIEINPRFGGGAPLSMKAGADSAEAVIRMLKGEQLSYMRKAAKDGSIYCRFDQSVCVSNSNYNKTIKGVIFDLDDTLYSEKQYVKSGYNAVAEYLGDKKFTDKLWKYFETQKPAIDELLNEIGRIDEKGKCLDVYREHFPKIDLYDGAAEIIKGLKSNGIKVGIITDGRVSGQKKKIEALGLDKLVDDIIITDELGGMQFRKPNDISFRIMQNRWRIPFEQMIYIGDNPVKDFTAPKQLGMGSIYFANKDGLYSLDSTLDVDKIDKLSDLMTYIC